jgi:ABC-type multidrug transport system fused ATPase/permease subunit
MKAILHYSRIFYGYAGRGLIALVSLAVLGSLVEGVGITLLFPLLVSLDGQGGSNDSVSRSVRLAFDLLHIPYSLDGALLLLLLVALVKGTVEYFRTTRQSRLSAEVSEGLRRRALRSIVRVDLQYVNREGAGSLLNLLITEVPQACAGLSVYTQFVSSLFAFLGVFAMSFALNARFTLLGVLAGYSFTRLFRAVGRRIRVNSRDTSDANRAFHSLMLQALQSFKYLQATARFARIERRLERLLDRLQELQHDTASVGAVRRPAVEGTLVVALVGAVWVETHLFGRPVASILVSLLFFYRMLTVIFGLQNIWLGFSKYLVAVDNVEAGLAAARAKQDPAGTLPYSRPQGSIRFESVSFSYGDHWVLRNLDLEIPRQATVAIVGVSGAGKSTLVDLVAGVLRPTEGRIRVDDDDLCTLRMDEWRGRLGYVTQETVLFDDTVANNISLWAEEEGETSVPPRVALAARRAMASGFIEAMPDGYATRVGERGVRLSGGQRQRLAIARELFKEPDLLILDEATSALDAEAERYVQESVDELVGRATVVLIAHRLSTVRKADRIYVLDEGRVVEEGTFATLMERRDSRFFRMYQHQAVEAGTVRQAPAEIGVAPV